jgi:NTP pyrophosphatase (non-canonical NTP hydrolase)
MDLKQYQQEVQRTCATTERKETLKMALIGLTGELGEIADPLKKSLFHGHDLDCSHIQDEVGDALWYLAVLCNALNISMDDAIESNVKKLRRRYPSGFSSERSINRLS